MKLFYYLKQLFKLTFAAVKRSLKKRKVVPRLNAEMMEWIGNHPEMLTCLKHMTPNLNFPLPLPMLTADALLEKEKGTERINIAPTIRKP